MFNNLEPCPYCGGEAELLGNEAIRIFHIQCKKCRKSSGFFRTDEQAITAWNTRAGEL